MSGTFQGVGTLQFTPDNKHAFAYSGIKTIAEAAFTNALEFDTGSYYLIAELSVDTDDNSTNNHSWNLYYNNTAIVTMGGDNSRRNVDYDFGRPIKLIIPPFTNFKLEGKMNTADIDWTIVLTADVKGTIEQLDLRLKNE
jgi:hypothetical protein